MSEQKVTDESPDLSADQSEPHSEGAAAVDPRTPFYKASHAERYQRQEVIRHIQEQTGPRLICYVAGIRMECMINQNDTVPFVDLLYNIEEGEDIDLLLHTIGGSVDAAEKLIRLVRSKVGGGQLRGCLKSGGAC